MAIGITLAAGLVRLFIGALTPLFPDETYYWDWSRQLAGGYFDHPPAIAWVIRAGTLVGGATSLGVRLGPVVCGVLAGLFLIAAARRLAGTRAAVVTALVFALMPLSAAGLILATPDAPLFAAAAGLVHAVLRALDHEPRSSSAVRWWLVAGAALGLAMSAKYTAALLPVGLLAGLLLRPELRRHAWSPGPNLGTALAIGVFSPVIVWNAGHDWASFAFQLRHGLGAASGSVLQRELDLLGGQAGLVTPILFVLMVVAAARARRGSRAVLAVTAGLVFAFFMYSATRRRAEANWPALAYVPATILLATHVGGRQWERWLRGGIALAALATFVTYLNTATPILPVPARRDPVARSAGWPQLARVVQREMQAGPGRTWVAADRYQEASELAFHLPGHPRTFSLNLTTRGNHYDFWPSFRQLARRGDSMVLVVDELATAHPTVQLLAPHFSVTRRGEMVTLARNGDPVKYLRIWRLDGWLGGWPQPQLRSRP